MSNSLAVVSTSTLQRIAEGVRGGRLRAPLTRAGLEAGGFKAQLDILVEVLHGHGRDAVLAVVESVLAERAHLKRPAPELVWTGPEGSQASARDTAVVLRELFEHAKERVLLGGYSFEHGEEALRPLHQAMAERAVQAHLFIHVDQPEHPLDDPEAYGRAAMQTFIDQRWPFGAPYPALYCDRRALRPGWPYVSLHAKCVSVDGEVAFVSSANFTDRGQDRNIEVGVLLKNTAFAAQLERQWLSLVDAGLVLKH